MRDSFHNGDKAPLQKKKQEHQQTEVLLYSRHATRGNDLVVPTFHASGDHRLHAAAPRYLTFHLFFLLPAVISPLSTVLGSHPLLSRRSLVL